MNPKIADHPGWQATALLDPFFDGDAAAAARPIGSASHHDISQLESTHGESVANMSSGVAVGV